jgi:hypothetical protein
MSINSHLNTCVGTQSPKYLEMTQGHISLSNVGDKYVDTYLASLDCKGIQNKVLGMSASSSLIGSLVNAIEAEPIIAK